MCFAIMPSLLDVSAPDGSERPAARSSPHISRPGELSIVLDAPGRDLTRSAYKPVEDVVAKVAKKVS